LDVQANVDELKRTLVPYASDSVNIVKGGELAVHSGYGGSEDSDDNSEPINLAYLAIRGGD
jgi:hypothetical protein